MESLGDRFRVERELGRGGMGLVLLAHDNHLDRRVAVKVLPAALSATIGGDRFAREIRVTARLVHPNIVPLFDSGSAEGRLYYVMPFVDGPTLRAHLAEHGRLTTQDAVTHVRDIAEALSYAHAQGVVHRDIKPENIFCYGGRAVLADFGIAKVTAGEANVSMSTSVGEIVGTLAYMSPEQGSADDVDARSDLYSLGCVFFEMLAGVPPYRGASPMAVLAQHMTAPVPDVCAHVPEVSRELGALVTSLLAKDPADRPGSAAALLDALRSLGGEAIAYAAVQAPSSTSRVRYSPESMAAYDEGRSYWQRGMTGGPGAREKLDLAHMYFTRARTLDPRNLLALVGLSDTVHVMGYRGFREYDAAIAEAQAYRHQALAEDDDVAEVHSSIGVTMMYWDDDFEGAGKELKRARDLGPDISLVRRFYGSWLKIAGRVEEALAEMRIATALSPDVAAQHNALGDILIAAGRFEEAIPHLRTALRLNPQYEVALERLEIACHRGGRIDEALTVRRAWLGQRKLADRVVSLDDDVVRVGWATARELDVRRELASFLERAAREDPFGENGTSRQLADQVITCYAELGEWRAAMDWIERGYHRRPGRLRRVLTDFLFDRRGLAVDPRYAPLLRMAGLNELLEENVSA